MHRNAARFGDVLRYSQDGEVWVQLERVAGSWMTKLARGGQSSNNDTDRSGERQGMSTTYPESKVRLARALVADAARRGTREDARIERIAGLPLPDDRVSRGRSGGRVSR